MRLNPVTPSIIPSLSARTAQALLLGACCLTTHLAYAADTVDFSESQKDELKCVQANDPDTCYQNTTGSYNVTFKVSEATLANNQLLFSDLNVDSQFSLDLGEFSFADYFSGATTKTINNTTVAGTWKPDQHDVCTKYDSNDECTTYKTVIDTTVKITRSKNKGATITLVGQSDIDNNGQKIFTSYCQDHGSGVLYEDAIIRLNDTEFAVPMQITCTVKNATVDPNGDKGGPYDVVNMTIKGKYGPNLCQ